MSIKKTLLSPAGSFACIALAALFSAAVSTTVLAQGAPQTPPSASAPVAAPAATAPAGTPATMPQAGAPASAPAGAAPAAPGAATDSSATPPAADAGATPSDAEVNNPYGLDALWKGGDFIARGTLIILGIMSMGTWYIMITKVVEQSMLLRQGSDANKTFWNANTVRDGANALNKRSAFRMMAEDGMRAAEHHEGSLTEEIDLHTWVTMSLQRSVEAINNRMQNGLAFLATVGSTAPFVGLFGTVWGIYHALTAIGIAGQASIDKVAGPVGEALIMTAFGLAVAVPAVLGYNWMVRRNKVAMDRVRNFSSDLHALLVGGGARTGGTAKPMARSA